MMKKLLTLLLFVFLFVACRPAATDRRSSSGSEPTPLPTAAVPLRPTYTVERGEVLFQVSFQGRISSVVQEPLAFELGGVVERVYVERGSMVTAGQLLAELDSQELEQQLLQAQASLAIAQARLQTAQTELAIAGRRAEIALELAQLDLDFAVQEAGPNPTPAQNYQISRLRLQLELAQLALTELNETVDPALQTDVQAADLAVATLQNQLAQVQLVAPFEGLLLAFGASEGRGVAAQESLGLLVDPTQLEITATLFDQQLINGLQADMVATVSLANSPGRSYAATVAQLPFATADEDEPIVHLAFDDPAGAADFQLNDRVSVVILIDRHADTLWLPPAAIREFNGRHFVVIQEGEFQRRADVTLGLVGRDRTEVTAGVAEGDLVVGQ